MGESNEMLNAALKYASFGWYVFPLEGKEPMPTTSGFYSATRDPELIQFWWGNHPDRNIGIATGSKFSHLVVIDLDVKEGKDGTESLREWEKEHGELPETVTAISGSGGVHLYYYSDLPFTSKRDIMDGVDIRADGGYIVAPPSIHPDTGRPYVWEGETDLDTAFKCATVTEAMFPLLNLPGRAAQKESGSGIREGIAEKFELPGTIRKGGRVDTLFRYTSSLMAKMSDRGEIEELVRQANQERCDPPLSDTELRKEVLPALKRYKTAGEIAQESGVVIGKGILEQESTDEDTLNLGTLDDVDEKEVTWLIPNYIPAKQITLLVGTGGVGKTSVWCSIESSISRGRSTFLEGLDALNDVREPKDVMFFSSEDTVPEVLKKKIKKCGGDMKRFRFIDLSDERFQKISFGSSFLHDLIARYRPALCVFDPLQSFIPASIKMSDRNAMRQAMNNLVELGAKYGTTFIVLVHTNKLQNVWGRARMADSSDIWDIARSVLMVGEVDHEKHLCYLSHEKSNYGYTGKTVIFKNEGGTTTFQEYSDKKDKDFVKEASKATADARDAIADCADFILSELQNGGMNVKDLDDETLAVGYTKYQLRKAKELLKKAGKIIAKKDGFQGQTCLFSSTHIKNDKIG